MTIDMIVDELRNCEYYTMKSTEYPNNKTLVVFKTDTKTLKLFISTSYLPSLLQTLV